MTAVLQKIKKFSSFTIVILVSTFFLLVGCSSDNSTGSNNNTSVAKRLTFTPSSGYVGSFVTVTSTDVNLDTVSDIKINGISQVVISKSTNEVKLLIMPGTTTGTISTVVNSVSAVSTDSFSIVESTTYPITQDGSKLIGTGAIGTARQGYSVAISADGNTVVLSGYQDNSSAGAAWVFTKENGVWTQQGNKLVGTGAIGAASQGFSVAISADGNTVLIGGSQDNGVIGAAWVFTRSNGVWTQQGSKLVGSGAVGTASQGYSVALSADGNTALIGGYADNAQLGAAWVFVRENSVWTQQGNKLVGTGATGSARQGFSVAISADGNNVVIGGYQDNGSAGAAWIFNRSNSIWTQQGSKLVGTGAIGNARQGISVSLSADGNNVAVGGYQDNSSAGAAWIFNRSNNVWTQQGNKLVGTGAIGGAQQGYSVALSGNGNSVLISGFADDSQNGATWVFTRSNNVWTQQGTKLVGSGAVGGAQQGYSMALSLDGRTCVIGGFQDDNFKGASWIFGP